MYKTRRGLPILLTTAILSSLAQANDSPEIRFRYKAGSFLTRDILDFDAYSTSFDLYIGENSSIAISASGGSGFRTWSILSGSLPQGLALNSSTGEISGAPTLAGSHTLVLQVEDGDGRTLASQPIAIQIFEPLGLSIASTDHKIGELADVDLNVSGGKAPFTYTIASGSLPSGFIIEGGRITGTPIEIGIFSATIRVRDANGRSATHEFNTNIRDGLVAGSFNLSDGYLSEPYSATFSASGGVLPYYWELLPESSFPDGLSLGTDGQVSGTPTQVGTFNYGVVVLDNDVQHHNGNGSISIYSQPRVSQSTISPLRPNTPVDLSFEAIGGKPNVTWSYSGILPPGLSLDPAGRLSGTATATGTFEPTLVVSDANGRASEPTPVSIHVFDELITSVPSGHDAYVGEPVSLILSSMGGKPPVTWSVGDLPYGLTASPEGEISGMPVAPEARELSISVVDALGETASATLPFSVYALPEITNSPVGSLQLNDGVSHSYTSTGGKSPLTWDVAAGDLPDGLELTRDGILSGVASSQGTYEFTARVTDAGGKTATRQSTMVIAPNEVVVTIASNETNVNVQTKFGANWSSPIKKRLLINSTAIVGGTGTNPAMRIPAGWTGDLSIEVGGSIHGAPGAINGGKGGDGIRIDGLGDANQKVNIINNGHIYAGGGGGGKGGKGGDGRATVNKRFPETGNYHDATRISLGGFPRTAWIYDPRDNTHYVTYEGVIIASIHGSAGTYGSDVSGFISGDKYIWRGSSKGVIYLQSGEYVVEGRVYGYYYTAPDPDIKAGGVGGNGGIGRGYHTAQASGANGLAGDTNAGAGGKGGNGGGWGASGTSGSKGADGNLSNGLNGDAGGLAGFSILNGINAIITGSGERLGR